MACSISAHRNEDVMSWKNLVFAACLALSGASTTACGRGFGIETPDGFAELESNDDYRYRATTAEGVVLAVRREDNEPKGGLDFWASAVENELATRGYEKVSQKSIQSKNGTPGKQLVYKVSKGGRPNVLWVAVFVTGSRVVVLETGGDEAHFAHVEPKVSHAISEFEVS
jgi:hypothetical protein